MRCFQDIPGFATNDRVVGAVKTLSLRDTSRWMPCLEIQAYAWEYHT